LIRAGLVGGFPINVGDFGFAAISIIIGLLSTAAMKKLRDVFDVLFGIDKRKDDMGDEPTPAANASLKLGASTTKINAGEDLEIRATASNIDGTYAERLKELVKERQTSSQHQKLMRGILLTN
jgi:hypothetical protein